MAMHIRRWDGSHLVNVPDNQLSGFCRGSLYVDLKSPSGSKSIWTFSGPDPVPDAAGIKAKIKAEVPNVKT